MSMELPFGVDPVKRQKIGGNFIGCRFKPGKEGVDGRQNIRNQLVDDVLFDFGVVAGWRSNAGAPNWACVNGPASMCTADVFVPVSMPLFEKAYSCAPVKAKAASVYEPTLM